MANNERLVETDTKYVPEPINGCFEGKHIISVEQFQRNDLMKLFSDVSVIKQKEKEKDKKLRRIYRSELKTICAGETMAELFFESSTRTDFSFQTAMQKLGGDVSIPSNGVKFSSVYKGENLWDTVCAIGCYVDVIVLRHPDEGSTYVAAEALDFLKWKIGTQTSLISGGDGIGEHPTQGLLDDYTMEHYIQDRSDVVITMVGDLKNGRTVHSLCKLLSLDGRQKTHVNLVSPESLAMPVEIIAKLKSAGISIYETRDVKNAVRESDVIYWTRIQEERFKDHPEEYEEVKNRFIMTPKLLEEAPQTAILMHPLPRKNEMGSVEDHKVLDRDPRSIYHEQMENGQFVRMALLANVLGRL